MFKIMEHRCVIATIFALSVLITAETIKASFQNARDTVAKANASVTNDLNAITTSGPDMIANLTERITSRSAEITADIKHLQQKYNESKYQACFAFDRLEAIFNDSINGLTECVGKVVKKAQRVATFYNSNVDQVMHLINSPTDYKELCKNSPMGEQACVQMHNKMTIAMVNSAVKDLTKTTAEAISYLGTLHDELSNCADAEVQYNDKAAQLRTNVTSCIQSVSKA